MTSAVDWLGALKRWQRRAFQRSTAGEQIPIRADLAVMPGRSWRCPELQIIEHERRVEFALHLAGAEADSTRIGWSEETQTLSIHAAVASEESNSSAHAAGNPSGRDWYAEVRVPSDVDGSRAKAFLKDGSLRIIAPRIDWRPLTGLPLWVWADTSAGGTCAATS